MTRGVGSSILVLMATTDMPQGQALLEREERALAEKKAALKAAGVALEARRRAEQETRDAFNRLRTLGFGQRDLTTAFDLTRGEAAVLFPRKGRKASTADAPATSAAHEGGHPVEGAAE